MMSLKPPASSILSVSQLNRSVSRLLGEQFFSVWVQGEISNLSAPASGHWYFSLKDANAQVRCALFKNQQRRSGFKPENGKQVLVKAQVSLYEPRGDYQLIVDSMEEAGDGALRRAFDALKTKLASEGLFAAEHKQPLPTLPQCIGVVTSPTGAAIRDILTVLKRRFAAIPVIIYPVTVQGDNAQFDIAQAIATANQMGDCDVLIIGRGGGSLEDLWAFNEERVARAIFASRIPVISAVGHETDFTIADFVADLRAATPSAAAEHATPNQQDWLLRFVQLESRLQNQLNRKLQQQQQKLDWLNKRLQAQHSGKKLARNQQRLSELQIRLSQAVRRQLLQRQNHLEAKTAKLWQFHPRQKLAGHQQHCDYLSQRLFAAVNQQIEKRQQSLLNASQTLHAVSPLATLNRGYALVSAPSSGQIIHSTAQLQIGKQVQVRLAEGRFNSQVIEILPG
ncbi:exodeoxyribonuclease VII large subunit [Methylosoma difficile]